MGNKKRSNPYKTKQNSTALCDRDSQVVQWWGTAVASEMSGLED